MQSTISTGNSEGSSCRGTSKHLAHTYGPKDVLLNDGRWDNVLQVVVADILGRDDRKNHQERDDWGKNLQTRRRQRNEKLRVTMPGGINSMQLGALVA